MPVVNLCLTMLGPFSILQLDVVEPQAIPMRALSLENCLLVARPCPRLRPMSSNPAVAAPAAQVPLRHAREVHRCTLFGTSQAWDIPDVLRGLHRESPAFKAWRMAQLRLSTTTTRVPRTQKHSLFREGSCRLSKIIPPCAKDERQT